MRNIEAINKFTRVKYHDLFVEESSISMNKSHKFFFWNIHEVHHLNLDYLSLYALLFIPLNQNNCNNYNITEIVKSQSLNNNQNLVLKIDYTFTYDVDVEMYVCFNFGWDKTLHTQLTFN